MSAPADPPRLRRFELLEALGAGATGVTWKARARVAIGGLRPGDPAAVKVLHPHLAADPVARRAFLREARAGMAVRHPNLVRTHAVEEVRRPEGRLLYLVLEFVAGRTVRDWLEHDGVAGEPTLRTLARQVAGALAALHGHGLLHLDVKPENLIWDEDRAVLMDLGFAREPATAAAAGFLGTPAYAAPEVLAGQPPGPAADLFALGVTLYEAATGQRPFGDERRQGLFEARRTALVRRPSSVQPRLSPFLDEVLLALLAEQPERRPTADELERILDAGEQSPWWRQRARVEPLLPVVHRDALPFAGRDPELADLEDAFAAARASGRPRLVLLEGPEGVGKSRLALEFAGRWRRRSEAPPLLYGRCLRRSRPGSGSALQPMRDALARSLGLTPGEEPGPAAARRLTATLARDDAITLIEILRGTRAYPRERRVRSFLAWLQALVDEGPLLLFLDDIHLASANLLDFLDRLVAGLAGPILILAAHGALTDRAVERRRRLLGHRRCRSLLLRPLPATAIDEILVRAFAPGGLPPRLARDLAAASDGLPGTLEVLLRLLRQRGDLDRTADGYRAVRKRIEVPATPSQERLLLAEIAAMAPEDRSLLQWAALFRPPLRIRLLAQAAGLTEARTARILERLRDQGWLKIEQGSYRFALQRDRTAAYRSLDREAARARHETAYRLLRAAGPGLPGREAGLAFHAHRAGLAAEALEHGLPRLEQAIAAGSWEQAGRALDLLEEDLALLGERAPEAARIRLLVARAAWLGAAGRHAEEAEKLREAGERAAAVGDPLLRARVHLGLARHAHAMGFAGAARIHAERARRLREEAPPPSA
ncbi:MAG: hypothetical protein D6702_09065 [Planctomycetota bacterium]|nr:MAG: hypothetical protein D6702_09065 [Planctomycetota bacterium]